MKKNHACTAMGFSWLYKELQLGEKGWGGVYGGGEDDTSPGTS